MMLAGHKELQDIHGTEDNIKNYVFLNLKDLIPNVIEFNDILYYDDKKKRASSFRVNTSHISDTYKKDLDIFLKIKSDIDDYKISKEILGSFEIHSLTYKTKNIDFASNSWFNDILKIVNSISFDMDETIFIVEHYFKMVGLIKDLIHIYYSTNDYKDETNNLSRTPIFYKFCSYLSSNDPVLSALGFCSLLDKTNIEINKNTKSIFTPIMESYRKYKYKVDSFGQTEPFTFMRNVDKFFGNRSILMMVDDIKEFHDREYEEEIQEINSLKADTFIMNNILTFVGNPSALTKYKDNLDNLLSLLNKTCLHIYSIYGKMQDKVDAPPRSPSEDWVGYFRSSNQYVISLILCNNEDKNDLQYYYMLTDDKTDDIYLIYMMRNSKGIDVIFGSSIEDNSKYVTFYPDDLLYKLIDDELDDQKRYL